MLLERFRCAEPVVDVGSGTGSLCRTLRSEGVICYSFEPSPSVVADVRADLESLPLRRGAAGTVLLFDVIEHLDDPVRGLSAAREALRPGGQLLVSVPAHPRLWSERDTLAGHRRRYRRADLAGQIGEAGFVIEHVTGFQMSLLPVLAANRLIPFARAKATRREDELPGPLNRLSSAVLAAECRAAQHVALPTGSSLFAVARASGV